MKAVRFLLDANLSPETADFLRSLVFDVKSLIEEGLGDLDDEEVIKITRRENRILVTFDLDFAEVHYFSSTRKNLKKKLQQPPLKMHPREAVLKMQ